jgi:hypothetical protein
VKVKLTKSEAARLGEWRIWANERPKEFGVYWLAAFWTDKESAREFNDPQTEPDEPFIWEFDEAELKHYSKPGMLIHLAHLRARNLIWYGPVKPPSFKLET